MESTKDIEEERKRSRSRDSA